MSNLRQCLTDISEVFLGGTAIILAGALIVAGIFLLFAVPSIISSHYQAKNFNNLYHTHYTTSDMFWNDAAINKTVTGMASVKKVGSLLNKEK